MGETSVEVGAMPKENIRDRYELDGHDTVCATAEVTWDRGKDHVSVAVIRRGIDGERVKGEGNDGMYVRLDRAGVNRMIRALRRARDAAFGPDA